MRRRATARALRIVFAVVCAASFTRAASAGDLEIPPKLLNHEARVRAAFTPAQKSHEAALEARVSSKMSVHDVTFLTQGATQEELFAVMMKYMKDCQKDARESRKLADAFARQRLGEKASKLAQESARLDASMQEAKEKAQIEMDAATTGMVMGVASGAAQIGGAAIVSPRDAASGQATGKRQHKPLRIRTYYDQSVSLSDGRLLLVNTRTGENELGDASQPGMPPLGEALPNGTYRKKDGSLLVVKAGLVLKLPTPTPTPFPASLGKGVPVLR